MRLGLQKSPKSLEEKKGGNSAGAAIAEDIADDKSDVSAITTKTTKSKSGKALDKHCSVCDKTLSGANWNKHVVKVHKGLEASFSVVKGDIKNEGKYRFELLSWRAGAHTSLSYLAGSAHTWRAKVPPNFKWLSNHFFFFFYRSCGVICGQPRQKEQSLRPQNGEMP